MHDQTQSPLFLLPGELRNEIYKHCLTSSRLITDPCVPGRSGYRICSRRHDIPPLGVAILRTCQRAFYEAPVHLLYTSNVFRFTTSTHAHWFFIRLGAELGALIKNVQIDLYSEREVTVRREWCRYLAWDFEEPCIRPGTAGKLCSDALALQALSLDIGREVDWGFLETALDGPKRLSRISVRGDKSIDSEKNLSTSLVGTDDTWIRPNPITRPFIISAAGCVAGEPEEKLVKWEKMNGHISLEVVNQRALTRAERNTPLTILKDTKDIPSTGFSTLVEFESYQDGLMGTTWEFNPISS